MQGFICPSGLHSSEISSAGRFYTRVEKLGVENISIVASLS